MIDGVYQIEGQQHDDEYAGAAPSRRERNRGSKRQRTRSTDAF